MPPNPTSPPTSSKHSFGALFWDTFFLAFLTLFLGRFFWDTFLGHFFSGIFDTFFGTLFLGHFFGTLFGDTFLHFFGTLCLQILLHLLNTVQIPNTNKTFFSSLCPLFLEPKSALFYRLVVFNRLKKFYPHQTQKTQEL